MNLKALRLTNTYFARPVLLHVAQSSTNDQGRRVRANPPFISQAIKANVQPLNSHELRIMHEGERRQGLVKIYSQIKINISKSNLESDIVEVDNKFYKAIKLYDRSFTSTLHKTILEFLPSGLPT